jgi:hypothetical protein
LFEVLGQPPVSIDPCKGSHHDPAAGQDGKPLGTVRTLDGFDISASDPGQRVPEFRACITAIGEHMVYAGFSHAVKAHYYT